MNENQLNSTKESTNVREKKFGRPLLNILFEGLWRYAPGLSKQIVKRLFFAPARYPIRPLEKKYLRQGRAFEIRVNDSRVKCWKWGRGPGVLLAHGWNGRGIQLHCFIQSLTEAGYTVVTFDGPGHGESEGKTSSYFEYSDVIRHFFKFAADYHIKGAIAHSFGAAAVINAMVKENYPVEAVLIAPALKLNEILEKMFYGLGVPEPLFKILIEEYEAHFGYNLRADDPIKLLKQVKSRILVVHDQEDETISYGDSLAASRITDRISLQPTHGLGHKRILYDRKTVTMIIKEIGDRLNPQSNQNGLKAEMEDSMKNMQQLIEDYRAADFERRVYLFLECPELRGDFIEIDQGQADTRAAVSSN